MGTVITASAIFISPILTKIVQQYFSAANTTFGENIHYNHCGSQYLPREYLSNLITGFDYIVIPDPRQTQ